MKKQDVIVPQGMEGYYNNYHFAPAVKSADHLYCSGVIGSEADGKASSDPETQFTRVFETLGRVLAAASLSFADVVEMTTYHVDLKTHLSAFMKVKDRFIAEPYTAWTAIGITELANPTGLVEIRAIARLRN